MKVWQKGMSLIEVLVAMLIIGLALTMGISMIQASNRFGESAEFGSSALQQAQAIIDKIKSNGVASDTYLFTGGVVITNGDEYEKMYAEVSKVKLIDIPLHLTCKVALCSEAENIAKADVVQWNNTLQEMLPGGRGIVHRISSLPNRDFFEVIVMWNHNAEIEIDNNPAVSGIRVNFSL